MWHRKRIAREKDKVFRNILVIFIIMVCAVQCSGRELKSENYADEPLSEDLEAEARVTASSAEIIQLLEEDEQKGYANFSTLSKNPSGVTGKMDCSKITTQIFQVMLQNPDSVEPEDYSCGLLNFISQVEKSNARIRSLESSLYAATTSIKQLESFLHAETVKTQFLLKELNETTHKEMERAVKAENVIARRVLLEKSRVDTLQKNFTEALEREVEQTKHYMSPAPQKDELSETVSEKNDTPTTTFSQSSPPPTYDREELQKVETQLFTVQNLVRDLAKRISDIEQSSQTVEEKGLTQIFKTYASLANEIEKESTRATTEEASLKAQISSEVENLSKQIQSLQDRITDEKNRAQIIENRRTADLFEEINRAKSEETRLGQRFKEEMSKAAAAFKKLEQHVDSQVNVSRASEEDYKIWSERETKRAMEAEEKLLEQISYERGRALTIENSLKTRFESEVSRALASENNFMRLLSEEKDRAKVAEHELKVALDVETYRAKGVELSISAHVTAEMERAKAEENKLGQHINGNVTYLLTDIIKEFTRAQSAERELEDKISHEVSRAQTAEKGLLTNINAELTRAVDKEQELHSLIVQKDISIKSLDHIKELIELEGGRAKNAQQALESQIQQEIGRAKESEDNLLNLIKEETNRSMSMEANFTLTSAEVLRHTKELELEVRKTVMAEVARAVDAESNLKQQIQGALATVSKAGPTNADSGNYSDIANRLQLLGIAVQKDIIRLEDANAQLARNLTTDILTLAELFDDKLDDLEQSDSARFKKIEDEMKKYCSSSSWRWKSPKGGKSNSAPSTTENVLNKLIEAFTSVEDDSDGLPNGKETMTESNNKAATIGPIKSETNRQPSHKQIKPLPEDDVITPTSGKNGTVVVQASSGAASSDSKKVVKTSPRRKPKRSSRRVGTSSAESKGVSVQSANSKVTSTFG